ncbi:hypothetical protein [Roseovarius sp. CH_XMU1461]|uniref:hypothetical protein n=1 Tax=Roseovarius sp. CH_XMU1461 TaxID=3107777 RepID=UPI00300BB205
MGQRVFGMGGIGRIAVAGLALILLQACMIGGIYPDTQGDGSAIAATADEGDAPARPVKPLTQAGSKPAAKPVAKPAKPAATAGSAATVRDSDVTETRTQIDLSVTYLVRLLVPAGSKLDLVAKGPGGTVTRSIYTGRYGPPYAVSLPVGAEAQFPLEITATLHSAAGHVLRGKTEIAAMPQETVEIVMMPSGAE